MNATYQDKSQALLFTYPVHPSEVFFSVIKQKHIGILISSRLHFCHAKTLHSLERCNYKESP